MNSLRFSMTAHSAELDIDNPASADLNRLTRIVCRMDRFVKTDWRLDLFLKFSVVDHVLVV